jgi:PAS domain S-box-containing protein
VAVDWLDPQPAAQYRIEQLEKELSLVKTALSSLSIDLRVTCQDDQVEFSYGYPHEDGKSHDFALKLSSLFSFKNSKHQAHLQIRETQAADLVLQHSMYKELKLDLKTVLDISPDIIFISDGSGKALRVSSSCKNLWGYEVDNFIGKSVYDLEAEGAFKPSATRLVLETKEQVEITQMTKIGRKLTVIGTPVKDGNGNILRVVNVSKDITELSTLKQQLDKEKLRNESYRKKLTEILKPKQTPSVIFNSSSMNNILETAQKIAEYDSTILLLGESGVGKEVIANYIHGCSKRSNYPFIKINCGAIPENLLESELFGYEKGSFTGATKQGKPGLFEASHQGTIFLDEIGEIPYPLQVKLLRVLQEQEITRIGGTKPIKIDVRIIAATNRNLSEEVKKKQFREDLYYRLNVVPIYVPPLRDRPSDLVPLILHFTDKFNQKFSKNKHFSSEAIDSLYKYPWPGNVRELQNIIERIIVTTDSDHIEPSHLPDFIHGKQSSGTKDIKIAASSQDTIPRVKTPKDELSDTISIPVSLARNYRKLGMTHGEWGLLCTILTYKQGSKNPSPSEEALAHNLQCSTRQIRKWIYSIKGKNLLHVDRHRDDESKWNTNNYNFNPLLHATDHLINN